MYVDFIVKLINEYCLFFTTVLSYVLSRISSSSPETKLSVSARTPSRIMYFLSRRFHVTLVFPCSHARARADASRNCICEKRLCNTGIRNKPICFTNPRCTRDTLNEAFSFLFFLFFFFPPRFISHLIKQELLICDAGAASFHECENPHFNPRPTTRSSVALTLYRDRCITLRIIITCTCVNNDNSPVSSVPSLNCDVSFEYPPSRL